MCDCTDAGGQQLAPDWRSWLGDGSPQTPAGRQKEEEEEIHRYTSILQFSLHTHTSKELYLDEQGLGGGLHGGLELSLELGSLDPGLI